MKPEVEIPSAIRSAESPAIWNVEFRKSVAKVITAFGRDNADFNPTLEEMLTKLELDPKQFPKKHGKLKNSRAAKLRDRGDQWRLVFLLIEDQHIVDVIALDSRDNVYTEATRRYRSER